MKKNNLTSIADAISKMLSNNKLDHRLSKINAINNWKKNQSKAILSRIESIEIVDKTLHLKIKSSALKNEIMYNKSNILDEFNSEMDIIDNIRVY